jgi:hypothetical protein
MRVERNVRRRGDGSWGIELGNGTGMGGGGKGTRTDVGGRRQVQRHWTRDAKGILACMTMRPSRVSSFLSLCLSHSCDTFENCVIVCAHMTGCLVIVTGRWVPTASEKDASASGSHNEKSETSRDLPLGTRVTFVVGMGKDYVYVCSCVCLMQARVWYADLW